MKLIFIRFINLVKNIGFRLNTKERMKNYKKNYKKCLNNIYYINRKHKRKHYRLDIIPQFIENDNSQVDLFIKYLIEKLTKSEYMTNLRKVNRNHYEKQISYSLHIFWDETKYKKYLKNKHNGLFFNFLTFHKRKLTIDILDN